MQLLRPGKLSSCPHPSTPDDIPAYILKETANQNAASLTQVFKASLYQSKLLWPSNWKTAHVVPAHKKGDIIDHCQANITDKFIL